MAGTPDDVCAAGNTRTHGNASLLEKTGADGIGIGQGALGRPWVFEHLRFSNFDLRFKNAELKYPGELSGVHKENIFSVMLKHIKLVEKLKGERGIIESRKHLCWYVGGLPNARDLRLKLIRAVSAADVKKILDENYF